MAWPEPDAKRTWHGHVWRGAMLAGLTSAVIVPHYMLPATHANFAWHEIHRHLLYAPILLAALWYGWRGGLCVALLVSLTYFPHLLTPSAEHAEHMHAGHTGHAGGMEAPWNIGDPATYLLAMISYLLVGGGVGLLFGRLRRANAELNAAMRQLTEQTREMLAAGEQLRRADRLAALGQLTSGLAHEIRNPLAAIRGAAEILGDAHLPEERRREFSRVMIEETERLDHVLGNVLDYARTQKREQGGDGERAQLSAVLRRVLELLETQLDRQHITVRLELNADLPPLRADPAQLQQVLLNLLLNAIQAMPGGGEIAIFAHDGGSKRVRIVVADTGSGIPQAQAGKIFDPFFTTKPHGTGLGLAIVRTLVSGLGGCVNYEPNVPRGARFSLELPAED